MEQQIVLRAGECFLVDRKGKMASAASTLSAVECAEKLVHQCYRGIRIVLVEDEP